MVYDIIVGRNDNDRKKFGEKGTIFIGKQFVKMGQTTSLSNNMFLDIVRPHVVMVSGKRGSGKSYSLSVIAEEMSRLPEEIKNNLAILFFDTMGIFWTMNYPNTRQAHLLEEWDLKPEGMNINIFTPSGYFQQYKEKGIPTDFEFRIKTSELNSGDWCNLFDVKLTDPIGVLIERIIEYLQDKSLNYDIEDIIKLIREDKKTSIEIKNATENRFLAAATWGLFSKKGTEIKDLLKPGQVSVLDISCYTEVAGAWSIKALVIGIISQKLLNERIGIRKYEELYEIKTGEKLFGEEQELEQMPMVWLLIDECLPYNSEIITSKAHTKIGDIYKRFKKGEEFKVLGYDMLKKTYENYNVTNVFKKQKRNILRVKTETGRELKCTPDHRVLTKKGFFSVIGANEIATPIIQHYSEEQECIKARIVGHLFGDGWTSSKTQNLGFAGKGNNNDLIKIKEDLKSLGFSSSNIHSRKTKSKITNVDRKEAIVNGTSQSISASRKAFKFFSKLGVPIGDKVLYKSSIPKWILKSSKKVKSEFLSTYMGADGTAPSPTKNARGDFNSIRLSFNKADYLEKDAWDFAHQLKNLFWEFGIKISKITKRKGNLRKSGIKTIKIVITLAKNVENTINFLEKIGYRYCNEKEIRGNKWLSYLKARQTVLKNRQKLREKAIKLHKEEGIGKIRIAKKLNLPDFHVREWIYKNLKAGIPKSFPDFDSWINQRYKDNLIYENIIEMEKEGYEELYDISVDKVHNFVANGFIVHNCHEFLPKEGSTPATNALVQLLREGRQPGISLILATQQPGEIHRDVLTQSDIVLSHRLTAKVDIEALNSMMQTYLVTDIQSYLNTLPRQTGAGIILDDNSERIYPVQIHPKRSWHGGEAPTAIKKEKKLLDLGF